MVSRTWLTRLSQNSLRFLSFLLLIGAEIYAQNCPNYPAYIRVGQIPQFFQTPGYPDEYPKNFDCSLSLRAADSSSRIHISIYDSDFEDRLFSECPDYISIRDGTQSSSELVRWCGGENPINVAGHDESMLITFHSDTSIQRRGVNLSFVEFRIPGCPPGWTQPTLHESSVQMQCYKIIDLSMTRKGNPTWIDAQRLCNFEEGDLFTADSELELKAIVHLLARRNLVPWIGYHDSSAEGNFQGIDGKPTVPKSPLEVRDNEAEKDCVVLDSSGGDDDDKIYYVAEDCRERHPVLCKRLTSGDQIAHPPLRDKIRKGYLSNASYVVLWAIFLIVLILLLLLLWFVYQQCKKRYGAQSQVGPIESNSKTINNSHGGEGKNVSRPPDHSSSRVTTPYPQPSTPTPIAQDQNLIIVKEKAPLAPILEKGRSFERETEKARLATSPSPRDPPDEKVPEKEVHVKIPIGEKEMTLVDEDLKPRRDLPPLPMRETTYLSMKDPERSFLKTHRDGGLFDRPKMKVLDNVSAISLDEFWNNSK